MIRSNPIPVAQGFAIRQAACRAVGHLSDHDWLAVSRATTRLVEAVNRRSPQAQFDQVDALDVLARVGMLLAEGVR